LVGKVAGQGVELAGEVERPAGGEGKLLNFGPIMLVTELKTLICRRRLGTGATFIVEHLLHPKTRRRAVEQPLQSEVIVLRSRSWQFDDWRMAIEHFPTTIHHKVVVWGEEGKSNGIGNSVSLGKEHRVIEPTQTSLFNRLAVIAAISQS
jgi:hypothetical protein